MLLKMIDILNGINVLNNTTLGNSNTMNIKGKFKIATIANALNARAKTYDEMQKKLIDQYAVKDSEGKIVTKKDDDGKDSGEVDFGDNEAKFIADKKALLEQKANVDYTKRELLNAEDLTGFQFGIFKDGKIENADIEVGFIIQFKGILFE